MLNIVFDVDADDGATSFMVLGVMARGTRTGLNVGVDRLPCISF